MREYLILGPLEVRRAGETVDLGSPKQRIVLGALILARGAVVSVSYTHLTLPTKRIV